MKHKTIFLGISFVAVAVLGYQNVLQAQVLAQQGYLEFTQADLDKSIRFTEFLCGEKLLPSDIQLIMEGELADFNSNPSQSLQNIAEIDYQMQQIYAITTPLEIGLSRSMLIASMYGMIQQLPAGNAFRQIFNKYEAVLAIEPYLGICFTQKDFDAYFDLLTFYSLLSGQHVEYNTETRDIYKQDIINQFLYGEEQTKYSLAVMHNYNLYVQEVYNRLSQQEKGQFNAAITGNYQNHMQNADYSNQSYGGSFQNNDAQTNRMYFNVMQDMMLQQHATSLNIIENIGGTGNYWEVVDY